MFGLYLFVGFHINPLEQHTIFSFLLFFGWGGMCKCFRAIKREMKVSMDSMRHARVLIVKAIIWCP